ncbi:MAG: MFS transporter [Lachnospiraceae bacterium]|nr:MFS transporter [Lachnospiraceae bacterium]
MNTKRNKFTFGLGTVGRDMVYTMISMYLMFYLTDVLSLSADVLWWITGIIMFARIFDAFNDPFMGVIVDNTHSPFGRFKPWICIGGILSSIFTVLLFTDFGLQGAPYIIVFAILYLFWGISYTMHDISYWSMLPTLSQDLHEREKIGSVARICANIGLFLVVALIVPITTALGNALGSLQKGYFSLAIILVCIMVLFLCFTVFGVKEPNLAVDKKQSTSIKEMVSIIFKNDQLLVTAIANALFMIGYSTTTSFGLYYFKYVYGNEDMYSIFAVILGVSQIVALSVFPAFAAKFPRKLLYSVATGLVLAGYVIFFFAPNTTMIYIGIAGVLLFVGQAFIQVLMLLFLTDSVEYGEWKLGKRNDSVTFSLQPFINKMGGAIASGVVGAIVIISGMQEAQSAADMTASGLLILKMAMMVFPLVCIVVGFLIYRAKYILDEAMFNKIVEELNERNSK